jgi:capsular polysaccharide biosynthesis protein
MIPENVANMFNAIVAGVMGGLVLRLAQIINKRCLKKEKFWPELIISVLVLILWGLYLTWAFH